MVQAPRWWIIEENKSRRCPPKTKNARIKTKSKKSLGTKRKKKCARTDREKKKPLRVHCILRSAPFSEEK